MITPLGILQDPVNILFRCAAVPHKKNMLLIQAFFSDLSQNTPDTDADHLFQTRIQTEEIKQHLTGKVIFL